MVEKLLKRRNAVKVLLLTGLLLGSSGIISSCLAQPQDATTQSDDMLPLVTNKQADSIIITADKPTKAANLAAQMLAEHIQQMSGAKISILKERELKNLQVKGGQISADNQDKSTFILVGDSKLAAQLGISSENLTLGGIRLKTTGNALILLGADNAKHPTQSGAKDGDATIYAVADFLEKQLGVYYLWPGESGKVIPKQNEIKIAALDYQFEPIIKQRKIRHSNYQTIRRTHDRTKIGLHRMDVESEEYEKLLREASKTESTTPNWFTWQKSGGTMGLKTGHSYGYMWEKYGKDHPDWFAMQFDGSRDQSRSPSRPRLEVANPEVWQAIARDRIETIDKTGQTSVSIDPADGGYNTFSMSAESKALDPPEGRKITLGDYSGKERRTVEYVSLTDRYVFFWNNIAEIVTEKYPNVLLTARAYSAYTAPPIERKLHPNIVIEQVSKAYFDKEKVQQFIDDWTEWSKFSGQPLMWRPNLDTPHRRHGMPTFLTHRMAADIKTRAAAGMMSTDIDSAYKSWSQHSLNLFVLSRLLWDPSQDVDEIIDEYCQAGFGAGADYVKEYYAIQEQITEKAADDGIDNPEKQYSEAQMIDSLADSYNEVTLAQLTNLLDRAQEATNSDPDVKRRLDFLRRSIQYTRFQAEAFRLRRARNAGQELDKKDVESFMISRYKMMRELFFNDPLAMEIPSLIWSSEGKFSRLQSAESKKALAGGKVVGKQKIKDSDAIPDEDGNVEDREE